MKKILFFLLLLFINCEYIDKAEDFVLPKNNSLKLLKKYNFGYSEVRVYKISNKIIYSDLKNYPMNKLKDYSWRLEKWHLIRSQEIKNSNLILNSILEDQLKDSYKERKVIEKILKLLKVKNIYISDYYKLYSLNNNNISELDWIIIYLLDIKNNILYTIRNGER